MLKDSMLKDAVNQRPLPEGLRQKLRDIPRREVVCRDVERLYRSTRSEAHGERAKDEDRAARRHLAECPRCRELYATLHAAFAAAPRPVPKRLTRRLRAIARHPEQLLPLWIRDTRYAAAACYLAASLTLALAGDASAVFRVTTETVSTKAQTWVDAGETKSSEVWGAAASSVGRGIGRGWHEVARYGASVKSLYAGTVRTIGATTHELIPDRQRSVEGENDVGSRNDGK